jgi:hypothetical protein
LEAALLEAALSLFEPLASDLLSVFDSDLVSVFDSVFASDFESVFVSPDAAVAAPEDPFSEPLLGRLSVLYQPDPLNTIPAGKSTLRTALPHSGHSVTAGSVNFWKRSNRVLQARHSYSYVGMVFSKRV